VRVLLLANTLPPADVSGVGEQVLQLAAGLRQDGAEVEVLGRGPGGVAGPKVLFPLFAVPALWRALRRFHPDVVQVHESDGGLAALVAAWLAPSLHPRPLLLALLQVSYREERRAVRTLRWRGRVLGRPGAVERRFRRVKAPLQIALGWLTAQAADRVLAPSAATAAELRRDYRVREVAVVPNAMAPMPPPLAPPAPPAPVAATAPLALAPAPTTALAPGFLLVVGRLRIRKGVDVLLAAWPELLRRQPAARLVIAGDGEHRAALERAAAGLGLGGSVTFLGRADAAAVRTLMGGAAALVVPSLYEGMPLVVLEAMDAGLPVVASRVSGIPEVVEDGGTGWLVPPEDPASLAAALATVLADPAAARRRGAAGRARLDAAFRPWHAAGCWHRAVAAAAAKEISG
jgi:glycosyltransferase involved in cell wall biosynthesis